jgi:hypothetical protein
LIAGASGPIAVTNPRSRLGSLAAPIVAIGRTAAGIVLLLNADIELKDWRTIIGFTLGGIWCDGLPLACPRTGW